MNQRVSPGPAVLPGRVVDIVHDAVRAAGTRPFSVTTRTVVIDPVGVGDGICPACRAVGRGGDDALGGER